MITSAIVAGIKADLDNITFNNNLLVFLMGDTVIGDTECRVYGFDSSSSATPDGNFVIRPSMYASTNGRLLRRDWNQYYTDIRFKSITYTPSVLEITTALGYTPVTNGRTITINGVALDLSANRSWSVGDLLSSGSYADPSWIASLAWSKITGAPSIPVTSVFGRTGAVIAVNGDYTTTQVTEGTNLYYTVARFNSAFATKSTTDLSEGTNLYYTASRFNTAFSGKTTTDLAEGTNLYFTNARARSAVSLTTTGSGASTYNSSTGVFNIPTPSIPAQYNPTAGTGISITGAYPNQTISNTAPDQTVALTGANGLAVTGSYPSFTLTQYIPTVNSGVSRTLNSNFTISSTKQATVSYTISLSVTNPLLVGTSSAAAYLEYSLNAGSSWVSVSDALISSAVGVTVTVAITSTQSQIVNGIIPANALVRIRTATSGTASVVFIRAQETY